MNPGSTVHALLFLYIAHSIDTVNGRGFGNEVHHELQPKKTTVLLY